ncbi:MAG: FAD-dependent oxidoreductase [Bacillota bacterium]|nr:FAD-dependent oxidoreductase [Bacillota bacterium]
MAKDRVVVVGGGTGGTLAANLLARRGVRVTLVDSTGWHTYQPNYLYLPFTDRVPTGGGPLFSRRVNGLLDGRVETVVGEVTGIDHRAGRVQVQKGGSLPYDWLVLAPGTAYYPDEIQGYREAAHHFYSQEAALCLREALASFRGGDVVVGVTTIPYKCPPAPLEFTLMLDAHLRRLGLREKTRIHFLSPLPRAFTIEQVSEMVAPIMEKRGIEIHTFFNTESVDPGARVVRSLEGDEVPYDLLVLIPPHGGVPAVRNSGLGDRSGWIPTDRHLLKVLGHERLYALGDATDLPVSKSGVAAHFQAEAVAGNILAEMAGRTPAHAYTGRVLCFAETGLGRATIISFDYQHPPRPPFPNRVLHWAKLAFNVLYWYTVPQGRVPLRGVAELEERRGSVGEEARVGH